MRHRAYYAWLVKSFCTDPTEDPRLFDFHILLEQMWRKEYYFVIPNDENRAGDGTALRWLFSQNYDDPTPQGPCTFLEFMIGVAQRLSEMLADPDELPVYLYFWELCIHLGLTEYTDEAYGHESAMFVVDQIMTDFMDRKYGRDGCGGLFPLQNPHRNQKRREIYYQMQDYLMEHPLFFTEMRV